MKCKDCAHYRATIETMGTCFGIEVEGEKDPRESFRCKGRYFKIPRNSTKKLVHPIRK